MNASLQLYTIREQFEHNPEVALAHVSDLGYKGVEFAGFGNTSKEQMRLLLKKYNLYSVGSHTSIDLLKSKLQEMIDYNNFIGSNYIICPWAELKSIDDIEKLANLLNKVSDECNKNGLILGYHNHNIDFKKINGEYVLDLLFKKLKSEIVMELDIFWAVNAGVNLVQYIEKYKNRIKLIHLKQLRHENGQCIDCDIPDGEIDIKAIMRCSSCTDFIVEQESFDKPIWEGLERSIKYLNTL